MFTTLKAGDFQRKPLVPLTSKRPFKLFDLIIAYGLCLWLCKIKWTCWLNELKFIVKLCRGVAKYSSCTNIRAQTTNEMKVLIHPEMVYSSSSLVVLQLLWGSWGQLGYLYIKVHLGQTWPTFWPCSCCTDLKHLPEPLQTFSSKQTQWFHSWLLPWGGHYKNEPVWL